MRQLGRIILALATATVTYYLVYVAISLGWFGVAGANLKIGPSDLGVPEILFHLVTTGIAAAAAGLVAGGILTRSWAGTRLVVGGTVAVTAAFVAFYVLALQGQPDQVPLHVLVSVATAVILGVAAGRRSPIASTSVE